MGNPAGLGTVQPCRRYRGMGNGQETEGKTLLALSRVGHCNMRNNDNARREENRLEGKKKNASQLCVVIDTYAPSKAHSLPESSTAWHASKSVRAPRTSASSSLTSPIPSLMAFRPSHGETKYTVEDKPHNSSTRGWAQRRLAGGRG